MRKRTRWRHTCGLYWHSMNSWDTSTATRLVCTTHYPCQLTCLQWAYKPFHVWCILACILNFWKEHHITCRFCNAYPIYIGRKTTIMTFNTTFRKVTWLDHWCTYRVRDAPKLNHILQILCEQKVLQNVMCTKLAKIRWFEWMVESNCTKIWVSWQ